MPHVELEEKVNVILSPSLYWVKKLPLPIKYLRDVKKILPSIFEDVLPVGNYNYSAYKSGEEFFVFAYEDKLILDTLMQKGVSVSNIANVYFAQSEFAELEGAVEVNETQSMCLKDEILILVPSAFVDESKPLDAESVVLSGHTISLAQFGHIVDTKSLYKIAGVFIVLIVLLAVEWFVTAQKINEIEELKSALFEKEGTKSTMFENNAILKKQKTIYEKQTKLRESVSLILSAKLAKNETLQELSLKNKSFIAEFNTLSPATSAAIEKDFKASGLTYKVSKQNETWRLEVSL
jgi:hypothetical protein